MLFDTFTNMRLFFRRFSLFPVFNCTFYISYAILFLQDILQAFFRKLHTI